VYNTVAQARPLVRSANNVQSSERQGQTPELFSN